MWQQNQRRGVYEVEPEVGGRRLAAGFLSRLPTGDDRGSDVNATSSVVDPAITAAQLLADQRSSKAATSQALVAAGFERRGGGFMANPESHYQRAEDISDFRRRAAASGQVSISLNELAQDISSHGGDGQAAAFATGFNLVQEVFERFLSGTQRATDTVLVPPLSIIRRLLAR